MTDPTRTAFEKWAFKAGFPLIYEKKIKDRIYWNDAMEHCFRAWNAALAHRDSHMPSLKEIIFELEGEKVDALETLDESDEAYNRAVDDCITAVKRLMEGK